MMMNDKQFSLIDEPWILVRRDNGVVEEVSLLGAFREAHQIKELAGELPTQNIAILRLLLAIVYSVFTRVDCRGQAGALVQNQSTEREVQERWMQLWELPGLPADHIEEYLRYYEDRFYLQHPETPFYQVADLHRADGSYEPITQIITDVPSRLERRFFTNRVSDSIEALSFSEAARWLVNLQSWDYAGKKAATVGGAPNGGGTGWLGKLGVVYGERDSLFRTLLANFVLLKGNGGVLEFGLPCWEQPPKAAAKEERWPQGYVDLLTWQSRRVRLFAEGDRMVGVLLSYGDVFEKEDTFLEQMSGWHESSEKSQKGKFIPNLHKVDRRAWRDLNVLLPQSSTEKEGGARIPGAVKWLAYLEESNLIEFSAVDIRTIGVEYGSMQGIVNELMDDSITVNAKLLTKLGESYGWVTSIISQVELSDRCVFYLGTLAVDIADATGNDSKDTRARDGVRRRVQEDMYFLLDAPFKKWLASVDPIHDDQEAKLAEWTQILKTLILRKGDEMMAEASEQAFVGRSMKQNAFQAHSRFLQSIGKSLRGIKDAKEVS